MSDLCVTGHSQQAPRMLNSDKIPPVSPFKQEQAKCVVHPKKKSFCSARLVCKVDGTAPKCYVTPHRLWPTRSTLLYRKCLHSQPCVTEGVPSAGTWCSRLVHRANSRSSVPIQMSRDTAMSHRSQPDSGCRVQKRGSIAVCATVNAALALHACTPVHL